MYKSNQNNPIISVFDGVRKSPKKLRRIIAVACTAALIGISIPLLATNVGAQDLIYAQTTAELNIRKGTGTDYAVLKVLGNNTTVTVIDNSNSGWLKVRLSDGTTGYCSADYLDIMSFSYSGLVEQLEFEGFTYDQAVYGADKAY